MPRRVKLVPHLTAEEVDDAIKIATDPVQERRLRAIRLLQEGRRAYEVASALERSRAWVTQTVRLYNQHGPEALCDGRHQNKGPPRRLDEDDLQHLQQALKQPPPEGGRWSGVKVARWVREELGKPLHKSRGVEYLKLLGYSRVSVEQLPEEADQTAPDEPQTPFKGFSPSPAGLPFALTPYPSDLTDEQWAILQPLLPSNTHTHPRRIVNAVLYILRTGAPWAYLPRDFPPVSTVKTSFYGWVDSGVWVEVVRVLRERWRLSVGREVCPSLGLIDSQSVKTSEKGGLVVTTEQRRSTAENDTSS